MAHHTIVKPKDNVTSGFKYCDSNFDPSGLLGFCFGGFYRTRWATLHNGGEDFALDCSILLDLGTSIFSVLFNKVFSIPP